MRTKGALIALVAGAALVLSGLSACGGDDNAGDGGVTGDGGTPDAPAPAECVGSGEPQVVQLQTDDGVTLEGDLYLGGRASAASAVLLHMIPPANNRSNYPRAFIDALTKRGITVLNVDRRGAGNSGGVATEAYQGPNGRLDAKAAHDFLRKHACPVDPNRITYVGASNGTATVVDFTFFAQTKATIARVKALVLLSGGEYTEAQTDITEQRGLYEKVPTLFVYAEGDAQSAPWSSAFEVTKAPAWEFWKYDGADHGTALLTGKPDSIELIASFIGKQ